MSTMRSGANTRFARGLRKQMTDAELRLRFHLRRRQMAGFRFRKQHPIGPYVVDFICVEASLVIEVDGSEHLDCARDAERDEWLRTQGFRLLRFWNDDVLLRTDRVLATILDSLSSSTI
jgi:primosomal protein N' (replication factor Y)